MKRDEEVYSAIFEILEKGPCEYEVIYKYVVEKTKKDINSGSLRTRLNRLVKQEILERNNGTYLISKKEDDKKEEENHVMLKKYIENILKITEKEENQLLSNPFEKYKQRKKLLEAKEVYDFNKELQIFLNLKLKNLL